MTALRSKLLACVRSTTVCVIAALLRVSGAPFLAYRECQKTGDARRRMPCCTAVGPVGLALTITYAIRVYLVTYDVSDVGRLSITAQCLPPRRGFTRQPTQLMS